jgi:hypothetical protein
MESSGKSEEVSVGQQLKDCVGLYYTRDGL